MTVNTIDIVGSGAMGAGIPALSKAKDDVLARLARLIDKGHLPPDFLVAAERRLTFVCRSA
jgi:hypothetical protein